MTEAVYGAFSPRQRAGLEWDAARSKAGDMAMKANVQNSSASGSFSFWIHESSPFRSVKRLAQSVSYLLLNVCWWVALQKRRSRPSKPVQSVTVLCLIGLGDWCPNLSLVRSLKQVFPQCKLCVITDDLGAQFLLREKCADAVMCLPAQCFRRFKVIRRVVWVLMNRKRLVGDLLVCPLWHRTHQLIACMLPHQAFYGCFRIANPLARRHSDHFAPIESNVPAFRKALSALETQPSEDVVGTPFGNLRLLVGGLGTVPRISDFQVGEADRKWLRSQLPARDESDYVVVLHLGRRWENKGWPPHRWVEAILLLHQDFRLLVCLVGTPGEAAICKEVEAALKTAQVPTLNFCGVTTVTQLAALLQSADLFLGTDSGPTHLASIMGTSAVALYGPTDPEKYRPVRFKGIALHQKLECSPCGDNRCALRGEDQYRCMKDIEANRVYEAAQEVLKASPSGRSS